MKIFHFKDPIIDEQFRIILDQLYSHREIYPSQLSTPTIPWWFGKRFFWAWAQSASRPVQQLMSNTGSILTRASAAGGVDKSTAYEEFAWIRVTALATRGGWTVPASSILNSAGGTTDHFLIKPYACMRLQLDSVANCRANFVLGNTIAGPPDDVNPWLGSGSGAGGRGGIAFVFGSATSANWQVMGKYYTSVSYDFLVDTGIQVVANSTYQLEMAVRGEGSNRQMLFYINGQLVHTATGNTTAYANTTSQFDTSLNAFITNVANPLQISVSQLLWGSTHRAKINSLPGFTAWDD
jgi:hypothetical protein